MCRWKLGTSAYAEFSAVRSEQNDLVNVVPMAALAIIRALSVAAVGAGTIRVPVLAKRDCSEMT
ncbi:hypothetical protein CK489_02875 [Bradyrhizobium sp. UFLA03-84]|nr:hypothetical protein CK489_02875 [Bradyrhizobium sp. UFLA03-84]